MPLINRVALEDRVAERYYTLAEAADQLLSHGILGVGIQCEVALDDVALLRATEAYFMVSEAYKIHFGILTTEPPKIAAMTSLALADFRPLRAMSPDHIANPYTIYANELLSLSWAARPLGHDFNQIFESKLKRDGLYRYLRMLKSQQLRSLDEYKADIRRNPSTPKDEYDIRLDHDTPLGVSQLSDLPTIENMILIFELMWDGTGRMTD